MKKISFVFILCVLLSVGLANCASSDSEIQAIAAAELIEEQIEIGVQETLDMRDQTQTEVAMDQTQVAMIKTQESLQDKCFPGVTYEDDGNEAYLAGYVDILKVETSLESGILKTIMYLRDLPEEIIVNYAKENLKEYEWVVLVDVDQDQGTGGNVPLGYGASIASGIDFSLSLARYSIGPDKQTTGPIEDVMGRAMVMENIVEEFVEEYAEADFTVDYEMNTLTLEGTIPGISEESILYFETYAYKGGMADSLCK
jgi:hypothetical protein